MSFQHGLQISTSELKRFKPINPSISSGEQAFPIQQNITQPTQKVEPKKTQPPIKSRTKTISQVLTKVPSHSNSAVFPTDDVKSLSTSHRLASKKSLGGEKTQDNMNKSVFQLGLDNHHASDQPSPSFSKQAVKGGSQSSSGRNIDRVASLGKLKSMSESWNTPSSLSQQVLNDSKNASSNMGNPTLDTGYLIDMGDDNLLNGCESSHLVETLLSEGIAKQNVHAQSFGNLTNVAPKSSGPEPMVVKKSVKRTTTMVNNTNKTEDSSTQKKELQKMKTLPLGKLDSTRANKKGTLDSNREKKELPAGVEVFLNVSALTAENDRKALLKKNLPELQTDPTLELKAEDITSLNPPKAKKIGTPISYTRSKVSSKKAGDDKIHKSFAHSNTIDLGREDKVNLTAVASQDKKELGKSYRHDDEGMNVSFTSNNSPGAGSKKTVVKKTLKASKTLASHISKLQYPSNKDLEKATYGAHLEPTSTNLSFSIEIPSHEKLLRKGSTPQSDAIEKVMFEYPALSFGDTAEGIKNAAEVKDQEALKKSQEALAQSIKRITHRTLFSLRSIIKPTEKIIVCSQAFVKLFAGFDAIIPSAYATMDNIDWVNVKHLLNSTETTFKLIGALPSTIENKKLPQKNVKGVVDTLSRISDDLREDQPPSFNQIFDFLIAAVDYYKFYEPVLNEPEEEQQDQKVEEPVEQSEQEQAIPSPIYEKEEESPKLLLSVTSPKSPRTNLDAYKVDSRKASTEITKKAAERAAGLHKKSASSTKPGTLGEAASVKSRSKRTSIKSEAEISGFYMLNPTHSQMSKSQVLDDSQISSVHSEMIKKKREAITFRGKVSRLLADHERYVKRQMKVQQDKQEEMERLAKLEERRKIIEQMEEQSRMERMFLKELELEKIEVQKKIKEIKAKQDKQMLEKEVEEELKYQKFLKEQKEKKKEEKKTELVEQFKKIQVQKQIKKLKQDEEASSLKNEIINSKVGSVIWKDRLVDKDVQQWRQTYSLLEKLIGDAK